MHTKFIIIYFVISAFLLCLIVGVAFNLDLLKSRVDINSKSISWQKTHIEGNRHNIVRLMNRINGYEQALQDMRVTVRESALYQAKQDRCGIKKLDLNVGENLDIIYRHYGILIDENQSADFPIERDLLIKQWVENL